MNTTHRVAATPGNGLVHREGDTILIAGGENQPDEALASKLLTAMMQIGDSDGMRALARVLLAEDTIVPIAVITLDEPDASVFLYGALDLVTSAGRVSAAGTVLGRNENVTIADGLAVVMSGTEVPELPEWAALGSGAVSGSGVVVFALGTEQIDVPSTGSAVDHSIASPIEVAGSVQLSDPDLDPIEEFEVIELAGDMDLSSREPIPIDGQAEPPAEPSVESPKAEALVDDAPTFSVPVEVFGVMSPRGHFNHPEARYCSRSGVKMGASHTKVLIKGPRPPLGVITFDDGSTYTVQWNTVLGRDPFMDESVQQQTAAPLVIADDTQSVSRRHVLLELIDWDVLVSDMGSQNGTTVRSGQDEERLLGNGEKVVIGTGSTIRFGNRSFVYNEHHVR